MTALGEGVGGWKNYDVNLLFGFGSDAAEVTIVC